jgi:hypothetical protein
MREKHYIMADKFKRMIVRPNGTCLILMLPTIGQAQLIIILCNPSSLNKETYILRCRLQLNSWDATVSIINIKHNDSENIDNLRYAS